MILLILIQLGQEHNPSLKNYFIRTKFLIRKVRALDSLTALEIYLRTRFPNYKEIKLREQDHEVSFFEVGFDYSLTNEKEYLSFTVEEVLEF